MVSGTSDYAFFSFILYMFLIVYIISFDYKSPANRFAIELLICLSFWSGGMVFIHNHSTPQEIIKWVYNAYAFGWIFFPPFAFLFMLEISGLRGPLPGKILLPLVFLPAPIILLAHLNGLLIHAPVLLDYGWFAEWQENFRVFFYYIYYFSLTLGGTIILLLSIKGARSPVIRVQRIVISFAVLVVLLIGTFIEVVLPRLKSPSGSMGDVTDLFIIILAPAMIYSIRYLRLLEITPSAAADEIVRNMDELLIIIDNDFMIKFVNNPLLDATGYQEYDLLNRPYSILAGTEFDKSAIMNGLNSTGKYRSRKFLIYGKNNRVIPVIFSASTLRHSCGINGIVCVATDISDIKKAQDAMQESYRKLKELDALKTNFTFAMFHELHTPMTSIKGFLHFLPDYETGPVTSQQKYFLETINNNSERLLSLLNDMLDISKMESGTFLINK
jgi:PAS domain S-box-containing protein